MHRLQDLKSRARGSLLCVRIFAVAMAAFASWSVAAAATFTWAIADVYSNADGSVQYIQLIETSGQDGLNALTGLTIVSGEVLPTGTIFKTFTFDHDLPSASTANKSILIATPGYTALSVIVPPGTLPRPLAAPDYIMPARFLPTDMGSLTFNAAGQGVFWLMLPIDGVAAQGTAGAFTPNVATNFAGQSDSVPRLAVGVVEFYNAALDHYFMSPLEPDIEALDTGRIPGWTRTGYTFQANPPGGVQSDPPTPASPVDVCRYYIPPQHGDSHFFSASSDECQAIADKIPVDPNFSGYVLETSDAFELPLPDTTTGACLSNTLPVYRLWNHRADSNHRYVTDLAVRAQMIARGYVPEGYGDLGVAMCAFTAYRVDAR
jgi:hypothetical protein